jgi:spore coat polysaccharide biosynthesis protein SpsF
MKINIVIQARLSSSRFPRKIFSEIRGKRIIDYVIDASVSVRGKNQVIVVIPEAELELKSYLSEKYKNIIVFAGHMTDVRSRFVDALFNHPCDAFIRVCADNPLLQPEFIEDLITCYKETKVAYIYNDSRRDSNDNFIDGFGAELVDSKLLLKSLIDTSSIAKEHVTYAISNFNDGKNQVSPIVKRYKSNLTLDVNTIKDFNWLLPHLF